MSASAFIARIAPVAVQLRVEGSSIFPSVRIAQAGLETGWKIPSWNNLGGIKVGSGTPNEWWDGSSVKKGTWEVINGRRVDTSANFRAYKSVYHFYKDQDLLFGISRYERVRTAKTPEEQASMLQACGYATDPQYAAKLVTIIASYGLKRYDQETEVQRRMIEDLKKQTEQLQREVAALRKDISSISNQVGILLGVHAMDQPPPWAREAVDAAVAAGVVDTPTGGSLDFYRVLTVMHRKGLI